MPKQLQELWKEALAVLRKCIWQIFAIHLAYIALGLLLFTPMTGLLGQILLNLSGQSALSDLDIAYFFLTPAGMLALIFFVSLLLTILVFEQASLMVVCAAALQNQQIRFIPSLLFTLRRARIIFLFAVRLVLRILFLTLPFIGLSLALAWVMLTNYDINYYLATTPPVFIIAVASIGLVLLTMAVVLIRNLCGWYLALPLILFNYESPAHSFVKSEHLTLGNKQLFLTTLGSLGLSGIILSTVSLGIVQLLGSMLAPFFFNSIRLLVPVLGALMLLWSLANLLVTTFTSGSFAALLILFYDRKKLTVSSGVFTEDNRSPVRTIPPLLFFVLLLLAVAASGIAGTWLLKGIPADNDAMIFAHRGAAGRTPENTLIAMQQAISDGSDWLEIDVQESADGVVVVIHDSDFMKLARANLEVWKTTFKEMKTLDMGSWFDAKFSTERVPTLAELLAVAKGRCRVLIELKYYGHDQQLEQRVADIVEQAGMEGNVAIMSLEYEGIKKFRNLRPDWPVGLLSSIAIGKISDLNVDFLAINMDTAKPAFIRHIHSSGKKVYIWTVNDQVSMSRMLSLGVDGIITDEPAMAGEVRSKNNTLNPVARLLLHTTVLLNTPIPQNIYRDQSP